MTSRGGMAWDVGEATVLAGLTLVVAGWGMAANTPDDGPWIGSWLDGVFAVLRVVGAFLIAAGIIGAVFVHRSGVAQMTSPSGAGDVSAADSKSAIAQRVYNPPHPPRPDWGQTLRGLGSFALLAAAAWYLAGGPAIDEYQLTWLSEGFDAYGFAILVGAVTFGIWHLLRAGYAWRNRYNDVLLSSPLNAVRWVLHQCTLVIGALTLALVTGLGISAFGA